MQGRDHVVKTRVKQPGDRERERERDARSRDWNKADTPQTPSDAVTLHWCAASEEQIVSGLIPARLVHGGSITWSDARQSTRGGPVYSVNQSLQLYEGRGGAPGRQQ